MTVLCQKTIFRTPVKLGEYQLIITCLYVTEAVSFLIFIKCLYKKKKKEYTLNYSPAKITITKLHLLVEKKWGKSIKSGPPITECYVIVLCAHITQFGYTETGTVPNQPSTINRTTRAQNM